MPRTLVRDLRSHLDQTVTVYGWVNARRLQRTLQFVIVRDPSGLAQVTHKRSGAGDEIEQAIESLTDESAVAITGRVADSPVVKLGGLEIIPERVEVLGRAETPLPIDERSGPEHRLDWRYLDVRLFVFLTHFPASVRPFYHMRPPGQPELTCSFDLLWRGLEITTGAQREHRYDVLTAQAAEKAVNPGPMAHYLNAFRFGCPPHGGLGMGLGRVLMVLLGLESIRDATFLFRGPHRLTP